jgi:hypothetical protein
MILDDCSGIAQQRVQQFDLKNGGDCIRIGNRLLYSNGAWRDSTPYGLLVDPPDDDFERCKLVVEYRQELLKRAVNKFTDLKRAMQFVAKEAQRTIAHVSPVTSPSKEDIADLRQLQAEVRACQAKLQEAKDDLDKHTPEWKKWTPSPESVQRTSDIKNTIDAITI